MHAHFLFAAESETLVVAAITKLLIISLIAIANLLAPRRSIGIFATCALGILGNILIACGNSTAANEIGIVTWTLIGYVFWRHLRLTPEAMQGRLRASERTNEALREELNDQ